MSPLSELCKEINQINSLLNYVLIISLLSK